MSEEGQQERSDFGGYAIYFGLALVLYQWGIPLFRKFNIHPPVVIMIGAIIIAGAFDDDIDGDKVNWYVLIYVLILLRVICESLKRFQKIGEGKSNYDWLLILVIGIAGSLIEYFVFIQVNKNQESIWQDPKDPRNDTKQRAYSNQQFQNKAFNYFAAFMSNKDTFVSDSFMSIGNLNVLPYGEGMMSDCVAFTIYRALEWARRNEQTSALVPFVIVTLGSIIVGLVFALINYIFQKKFIKETINKIIFAFSMGVFCFIFAEAYYFAGVTSFVVFLVIQFFEFKDFKGFFQESFQKDDSLKKAFEETQQTIYYSQECLCFYVFGFLTYEYITYYVWFGWSGVFTQLFTILISRGINLLICIVVYLIFKKKFSDSKFDFWFFIAFFCSGISRNISSAFLSMTFYREFTSLYSTDRDYAEQFSTAVLRKQYIITNVVWTVLISFLIQVLAQLIISLIKDAKDKRSTEKYKF